VAREFFFHWVTETNTTWDEAYAVKDEGIASLKVEQAENDFAKLSIYVKHPKIGLLNILRKQWAWLAYRKGDTAGTIVPLMHGQLITIPSDFVGEGVIFEFLGKPLDFLSQKVGVALTLMTAPNYEPIFIDPAKRLTVNDDYTYTGDPDTVLQGWSRVWDIDRITGQVRTTDILTGEDGTEVFASNEIKPEIKPQIKDPPATGLTIIGTVPWTQQQSGSLKVGDWFINAYNALSIKNDWPKVGSSLAGSWKIGDGTYAIDVNGLEGAVVQQFGFNYENKDKKHVNGDVMSIQFMNCAFPTQSGQFIKISESIQNGHKPGGWEDFQNDILIGDEVSQNIPLHYNANVMLVALAQVNCGLTLGYDAGIKRTETITIKMTANVQPLINQPDPSAVTETIGPLNGTDVGIPIDGVTPLNSPTGNNFFPTDRGKSARDYLISIGLAHFKQRARAIELTADIPFERAIELSCRKNATLYYSKLPGGVATGKIIRYGFSADGNATTMSGFVTIGCCIGYGGSVSADAGEDDYIDDDYIDDYYERTGEVVSLGEVGYTPPVYEPGPDEIAFPLQRSQVVVSQSFTDSTAQVQAGQRLDMFTGQPTPNIITVPTKVFNLELKPLNGGIDRTIDLSTTPVELPKHIDLAAAPNG